jgi:hypothetical protein
VIHPDTELRKINDEIGSGVFATKLIPRGSITWALDYLDHVLTPEEASRLPAAYKPIVDRYAFRDAKGRHVLCWDHGRFVNHSCDSTSLPLGSVCEIAIRDIQPGEQVTSDYVTLNLTEEMTCHCGSPRCRGVMRPSQLDEYVQEMDAKLKRCAALIGQVKQPVLDFMRSEDQERFLAIANGKLPVPSSREVVGG